MRFALIAVGSRGDVEPYIALGQRLVQRGHAVRLAAMALFEKEVVDAGLAFHSLGALPERFKPRTDSTDPARPHRDASTRFRGTVGRVLFWCFFPGMLASGLDRFLAACEGADAIVFTRLALPVPHIAEHLGIPCFAGFPVPHTPTAAFVDPLYCRPVPSGPLRTRASYALEWNLTHQLSHRVLSRFRQDRLGLPRLGRLALHAHRERLVRGTLHSYSEAVLPRPRDWPEDVLVTGYWFRELPDSFRPPPEVARFLECGEPPLCVGFGSMKPSEPRKLSQIIIQAAAALGRRVIWQSGWAGLRASELASDRVLLTGELPHGWLFSRACCVVHHGGAGTTGAALRAGVPSIVLPHAFDQPFWGQRLAALHCAPPPIHVDELSVEKLVEALRCVLFDAQMRERAADLGNRLRAEDGPGRAVAQLEEWTGCCAPGSQRGADQRAW